MFLNPKDIDVSHSTSVVYAAALNKQGMFSLPRSRPDGFEVSLNIDGFAYNSPVAQALSEQGLNDAFEQVEWEIPKGAFESELDRGIRLLNRERYWAVPQLAIFGCTGYLGMSPIGKGVRTYMGTSTPDEVAVNKNKASDVCLKQMQTSNGGAVVKAINMDALEKGVNVSISATTLTNSYNKCMHNEMDSSGVLPIFGGGVCVALSIGMILSQLAGLKGAFNKVYKELEKTAINNGNLKLAEQERDRRAQSSVPTPV